ncbi:murein biosynthesis integral membrane protein MurJ [Halovulum dunhuangense]|uniref:Probable lipid II flippase MurJ n=1 Tax=Halovulum dunhuangense TaxID=1505036 RepID=A0A849KZB6_9RHOB|nr:murein biosynthesis integral membrane protein MurJ [Halovulum dunhuangense]NNU78894.1 murein biosynthesis integral membrane protein MurJ [Halovulum dunhuangense]
MTRPFRLAAAFMTVGGWTLASRVMGFARDILIARYLGAGAAAEAFLVAFALPNMFRRFFAEGAFNMAFVPLFSKRLERGEDPQGFAGDAATALAIILVALTLLAQVFMPWLVLAMASGFAGDARFGLAVEMGRIAFPYILFISLAALVSGVLNALGRFWVAAAAPVALNVILVGAMVGAAGLGADIGMALAWAVPVAGIAQLALVWGAARRAGFTVRLRRPRLTPELKRLLVIAAPAALAGGVMQVNLLVGRQVASFTEGAVAWLGYADRLYQLPLGVVGIAIGVVLLPDLSRRLAAGDRAGGIDAINRAAEFSLVLTLPAAAALVVIPLPLISVLFERGAFGPEDSAATAAALAIYGLGLPAFVLQKVFQPVFFAREDTRSPFRYAVVAMVVNAALAIGLMPVLGYIAAALATTGAAWVMLVLLVRGARRIDGAVELDDRLRRILPRIVLSTVVMAAGLWLATIPLAGALGAPGLRYAALLALVVLGPTLYFGTAIASGAFSLAQARKFLRRG